ncbi:Hypothetical predicted protein [Cloeon dipterum]|nr:Hypothetical predicted protein [Cloeon dipterum]
MFDSNQGYFRVYAVKDDNLANSLWVNMDEGGQIYFSNITKPAYDSMFEPTNRYAMLPTLSFDFPYYGTIIRSLKLDIDGRICMGKMGFPDDDCVSNIAPLGTKLFFPGDNSYIKYLDTGKSFTVQWGNVDFYPPFYVFEQNASFQVTLYEDGTVQLVYKQMMTSVFDVVNDNFISDVTIGMRDSFKLEAGRNNVDVKPYGVIELKNLLSPDFGIDSGTVITMKPLPICNMFTSHESCERSRKLAKCLWCPRLARCFNYGSSSDFKYWWKTECSDSPYYIG